MKAWGTTLLVLTLLLLVGGCSSTSPESTMALAPGAESPAANARSASSLYWGAPIVMCDVPPQLDVGKSLAIIAGNPAISYMLWEWTGTSPNGFTVYYRRANDPAGTSWGDAIPVHFVRSSAQYWMSTSLCDVNGKPAISFMERQSESTGNHCVGYVRAKDPTGQKWGTPIKVNPDDPHETGNYQTMLMVNGNPAIWYWEGHQGGFGGRYVRANDPNGNTWGTPANIPYGGPGSVAVVNGHPAVVYGTAGQNLIFLRSTDANGDNWGSPQTALEPSGPSYERRLVVIDGNPAIAFSGKWTTAASSVRFIRALDADGTTWPAAAVPVTDSADSTTEWLGWMDVINGFPSIAFISGINVAEDPPPADYNEVNLNFVQALDSQGGAWETAEPIRNLGDVAATLSILEAVGSGAGVAYVDEWHALSYLGTLPAPPAPAVDVQLSTDKSNYVSGDDFEAVLTAVVTDEYASPIGGLDAGAFTTALDGTGAEVIFSESTTPGTYTGNLDISSLQVGDHTVLVTVTDTRDVSANDSAAFTVSEPGSGGTMHVGDLDGIIEPGKAGRWRVVFTVKIDDSSEGPVSDAVVSYSLSGRMNGAGTLTTGADGTASYTTDWLRGDATYKFTVNDVTHATKTYNSADNHDPDGDFPDGGNSITISGP